MRAPRTAVAVALVAVVGVFALSALVRSEPSRVVTIVNTTPFDLAVDVAAGDATRWTPLAIVAPGATDTVEEVADQGDAWTFRFRSAGITAGTLRLTRAQLQERDWRVEAPARVVARLTSEGVPDAPRAGGS